MEESKKSVLRWQIATVLLLVASIAVGSLLIYEKIGETNAQKAVDKAMEFINGHVTAASSKATLKSIERGDVQIGKAYKFTVDVDGEAMDIYVSSDGRYMFPASDLVDIGQSSNSTANEQVDIEGGFKELKNIDVCSENGKPLVYFFGLATSEDSAWEYPIFKDVVSKFGDSVSFHDNYLEENGLDKDSDVFLKYSNGSVPLLVIGCKYYRVSSGKYQGEVKEREALTNLICNATGNKPESICTK